VRKISYWVALLLLCAPLPGCSESSFQLAPESRLPRWFAVPSGLTRNQLSVTLSYDFGGGSATVRLHNGQVGVLAKVNAKVRDSEPQSLTGKEPDGSAKYPLYEVLTAGGISEVIEHRTESAIFYVNDEPSVRTALGVR
jgi:peptidoglycan hydrolase-like protein with peptidoglycan-binding domain